MQMTILENAQDNLGDAIENEAAAASVQVVILCRNTVFLPYVAHSALVRK